MVFNTNPLFCTYVQNDSSCLLSDYIIIQCPLEYTFYEVLCYYARQVILMKTNSNKKKVIVLEYISSEESPAVWRTLYRCIEFADSLTVEE